VSVPARRRQVAYGRERGLSARRACTLFSVARSALSYQGRKTAKNAAAIERMRELAAQYPRYGYRRIRIFLGRDGHRMSVGRAYRLWQAAGLQLPRKRPRKRVAAVRPRPQAMTFASAHTSSKSSIKIAAPPCFNQLIQRSNVVLAAIEIEPCGVG
jgi:putative transposase